ncbi:hypothetical protein E1H12_00590 [Geitlerinema sp. P-1104]|uniref:hypothetical protein n=1 Tax=Geitlerinema sp. P-1104 TaxID=2546230 RepID=UPI0014775A8C|nr:hypothetical protein [Geitlerinema sp. P-1104]NMG57049.1 hypothetical protein [Geitlerinema sp. P-1104]
MTNLNWQPSEYEWVEQVRQLLLELARSCLGDTPKLPMHLAQKVRPTAETATQLLDSARDRGLAESQWSQVPELAWTADVRALFLELAQVYLSDLPQLPDNLSARSLNLSGRAQQLLEHPTAKDFHPQAAPPGSKTFPKDPSPVEEDLPNPGQLISQLKQSLRQHRSRSPKGDAAEWQQLLNLLDLAESLYQRLKE